MRSLVAAWNRFWFEPTSTATLAVVRIAFGIVALFWTLSLALDLRAFFTEDGIVPRAPRIDWWIGLLQQRSDFPLVVAVFVALLGASVALIVGWHTRLAAALVFVGMLSFARRTPFIFNSGDTLVRNIALYLALAPAGVALSVDRWRHRTDRFWEFPRRALWSLRLMQVQLSVIYLTTVWAKVRGETWNDGTAVSYSLRLDDLVRFEPPAFLVESALWSNVMTYGTLGIELAIGILVWNRRARPYVLGAGVLMHVAIDLTLHVGFFSMAMLVLYLAFVPPETMERVLRRVAPHLSRVPLRPARRLAAAAGATIRTIADDDRVGGADEDVEGGVPTATPG